MNEVKKNYDSMDEYRRNGQAPVPTQMFTASDAYLIFDSILCNKKIDVEKRHELIVKVNNLIKEGGER